MIGQTIATESDRNVKELSLTRETGEKESILPFGSTRRDQFRG